jgi:hypothetical protein
MTPDRKDALPAKHSQQLRVSEHYSDELTIIDADGFAVVEVPKIAVLEGYAEKLGIAHWADSPAASRELSDEEHSALVRRIVQCVNAHDELVAALVSTRVRIVATMRSDIPNAMGDAIREIDAAITNATQGEAQS